VRQSSRPARPLFGCGAFIVGLLLVFGTGPTGTRTAPTPPSAPPVAAPAARFAFGGAGTGFVDRGPAVTLTAAQLAGATARYRSLPDGQRARWDALLADTPAHARGYLLKAFAAGRSPADLATFAYTISGHSPAWLHSHLVLVDTDQPGPAAYQGFPFAQFDHTSCGSMAVVVARATMDPVYALTLTAGDDPDGGVGPYEFARRLRAEADRVHRATNRYWPTAAGTPPWGVRDYLHDTTGIRYRWIVTDPAVPRTVDRALRRALAALDRGYPVPLLIGNIVPRHYVLLVGHDAGTVLFYEPTAGEVVAAAESDLRRGHLTGLRFGLLKGVIVPDA
jgi:hypothetical protein